MGIYSPIYHPRGTLVGIYSLVHLGGTLVGIYSLVYPGRHPGGYIHSGICLPLPLCRWASSRTYPAVSLRGSVWHLMYTTRVDGCALLASPPTVKGLSSRLSEKEGFLQKREKRRRKEA